MVDHVSIAAHDANSSISSRSISMTNLLCLSFQFSILSMTTGQCFGGPLRVEMHLFYRFRT
jgi:hypothetical protein